MSIFNIFRRRAAPNCFSQLKQSMIAADVVSADYLVGAPPKTHAEAMNSHGKLAKVFFDQATWHNTAACDANAQQVIDLARAMKTIETSSIVKKKITANILQWTKYLNARDERAVLAIINPTRRPWFLQWRHAL